MEISNDGTALFYKGVEINNVVVDRILKFMTAGLPVDPLIAFLEHENLPITVDGKFLAYKGVNDDYTDVHTSTFDNRPGNSHEMARNEVDDDARRACSNGFHVGSLEYATGFGTRTVIVEVDPADVVSVPYEDANKLRTSRYTVVADYEGPLTAPMHAAEAPYRG